MDKFVLLKQYFGHSSFRPGQEPVIDALLSRRDVLSVMPTGAGKSICYQLPALMLPGITLVISPLISLMKDQVAALGQAGIPAAYLNTTLSPAQFRTVYNRARNGAYKLIYVAPERLETSDFLQFARSVEISLVAVDESHCVSQWGQDFRPSYLKIADFISSLPRRPVVGTFTATATDAVKTDIEKLLSLRDPMRLTTGFDRPNLFFEVVHAGDKDAYLRNFLAVRKEQCGIVYCATRKKVEAVCDALCQEGFSATRYHAGLEDAERKQNQEDFVNDRARIMVATNAFGMGIDKSNVSFVVHYNMPKNIEAYYQEAGRAGRDGEKAHCLLLYASGDVQTARFLINNASDNELLTAEEQERIRQLDLKRLKQMVAYCKTTGCLRAYLLRYFGETAPSHCGFCGNCGSAHDPAKTTELDITTEAQKILSGIVRVEKKYSYGIGVTLLVGMLSGSCGQKVLQMGLDQLPTYGAMKQTKRMTIRAYIDCLEEKGYLTVSEDSYPVVHTTEAARRVLFENEQVLFRQRASGSKPQPARLALESPQEQEALYIILKALRGRLAQRERVPAYVIFSNATLADMAAKKPRSMEEFLSVSGVGQIKASRYGEIFLREIRKEIG